MLYGVYQDPLHYITTLEIHFEKKTHITYHMAQIDRCIVGRHAYESFVLQKSLLPIVC